LYNLLTSDEKAADFLIAHPDIIDSAKSTVDRVARNSESTRTLDAAALLLTHFPAEVQLSCAKQQLEDANRMRQALETTITQMRGEYGTQGELKEEVAALKRKNAALALENAALRDRANDAEACDELAALTATANALDSAAASEVKVKIESGLETEEDMKNARSLISCEER
jgi:regulator of replication initiation timing